jgi:hypothetical protein
VEALTGGGARVAVALPRKTRKLPAMNFRPTLSQLQDNLS